MKDEILKCSKHNYQLDQVLENVKYFFYFDGITLTLGIYIIESYLGHAQNTTFFLAHGVIFVFSFVLLHI